MTLTNHPRRNFFNLLREIQPAERDVARARARFGAVRVRLSRNFQIADARIIGSHARDTAVDRFSDVDLLIMLKRSEARWGQNDVSSTTILDRFRRELDQKYVHTKVGRDGQAIVVHFEKGNAMLDVVPAVFRRFEKAPIYVIPNGTGGWLESSPLAHNQFFRRADTDSEGRLTRTSRLLKWWKYSRTPATPVSSFYLDMTLASSKICRNVKSYSHSVALALSHLADRNGQALNDPTGLCGEITATATEPQLDRYRQIVSSSALNARLALVHEWTGDFERANSLWQRVFNGAFLKHT